MFDLVGRNKQETCPVAGNLSAAKENLGGLPDDAVNATTAQADGSSNRPTVKLRYTCIQSRKQHSAVTPASTVARTCHKSQANTQELPTMSWSCQMRTANHPMQSYQRIVCCEVAGTCKQQRPKHRPASIAPWQAPLGQQTLQQHRQQPGRSRQPPHQTAPLLPCHSSRRSWSPQTHTMGMRQQCC